MAVVFKQKGEELMLGPLSFVNHSYWQNGVYVIDQGWDTLKTKTANEKAIS